MAVSFYADESEDKDGKVHAIGGFIGFRDEWEIFEERWTGRLKPTGVNAYHMTDCECGFGEFSDKNGWTKTDRDQLTTDLIEIICEHDIFMIGAGVLLDDYRQFGPVDNEKVGLGAGKWNFVFQYIVQEACRRVGDQAPPEQIVSFFFDWKDKHGTADSLFAHMQCDDRLQSWHKRLGTVAFGHKEFDVPGSIPLLQVADIAAVETRKAIGNPITHPHLRERRSLSRLKQAGRIWSIKYFERPVLEVMYELKRAELGLSNRAEEAAALLAEDKRARAPSANP